MVWMSRVLSLIISSHNGVEGDTYSAENLEMWRIRVTAAETGAAEGVERIVPLGSEMDIAIRYCYCCVILLDVGDV